MRRSVCPFAYHRGTQCFMGISGVLWVGGMGGVICSLVQERERERVVRDKGVEGRHRQTHREEREGGRLENGRNDRMGDDSLSLSLCVRSTLSCLSICVCVCWI